MSVLAREAARYAHPAARNRYAVGRMEAFICRLELVDGSVFDCARVSFDDSGNWTRVNDDNDDGDDIAREDAISADTIITTSTTALQ
mmetsp:Transcript_21206/g.25226  ORF Transcript_21206/g.25226 Transcript_21206/m.25226 type:complete len:87 (+) Transcript_21206:1244-1504(+)